jgi:hypothetical protein
LLMHMCCGYIGWCPPWLKFTFSFFGWWWLCYVCWKNKIK